MTHNNPIFPDDAITAAIIYGPLMRTINGLHEQHGQPAAPDGGPTTGNHNASYWAGDIDFDPDDETENERIRDTLINELDSVYAGIHRMGHGGISMYRMSEQWTEFDNACQDAIDEFHAHDSWDAVCNHDWS